jgi:hypothetical protein
MPNFTIFLAAACVVPSAVAGTPDHHEFEATLHAPYRGEGRSGARTFNLDFDRGGSAPSDSVQWTLTLSAQGKPVASWQGAATLAAGRASVSVRWNGRTRNGPPDGRYRVRLQAALRSAPEDGVQQEWEIAVGEPAAVTVRPFAPMAAPSQRWRHAAAPGAGSLPYTVYYGNLHSQTNHSDGGAELDSCGGSQEPQSASNGPADAFHYARGRGLDFLMASEHNHMYDGADGPNPEAYPEQARMLYQRGLAVTASFNESHPDFAALYGMEWGVISGGGHVNILGANELLGWERDSAGQLFADTYSARNDYAALYTLMRQRGWVGQFNHPNWRGQFQVNGVPFGLTDDGAQSMALCEVLNTSAFSANTSETETRRPSFEAACNKVLEAGFMVAFSSNQDNHCANWGASYTNRTGILVPHGVPLSPQALLDAIRARRVFATMDKESQLVLTANGRLMGQRFVNVGPLRLAVGFANASGRKVSSVSIFEGVPGRNGAVTELAQGAEVHFTPAPGEHFYYAKVTQDDGRLLWSAPLWVSQQAPEAALE